MTDEPVDQSSLVHEAADRAAVAVETSDAATRAAEPGPELASARAPDEDALRLAEALVFASAEPRLTTG